MNTRHIPTLKKKLPSDPFMVHEHLRGHGFELARFDDLCKKKASEQKSIGKLVFMQPKQAQSLRIFLCTTHLVSFFLCIVAFLAFAGNHFQSLPWITIGCISAVTSIVSYLFHRKTKWNAYAKWQNSIAIPTEITPEVYRIIKKAFGKSVTIIRSIGDAPNCELIVARIGVRTSDPNQRIYWLKRFN